MFGLVAQRQTSTRSSKTPCTASLLAQQARHPASTTMGRGRPSKKRKLGDILDRGAGSAAAVSPDAALTGTHPTQLLFGDLAADYDAGVELLQQNLADELQVKKKRGMMHP